MVGFSYLKPPILVHVYFNKFDNYINLINWATSYLAAKYLTWYSQDASSNWSRITFPLHRTSISCWSQSHRDTSSIYRNTMVNLHFRRETLLPKLLLPSLPFYPSLSMALRISVWDVPVTGEPHRHCPSLVTFCDPVDVLGLPCYASLSPNFHLYRLYLCVLSGKRVHLLAFQQRYSQQWSQINGRCVYSTLASTWRWSLDFSQWNLRGVSCSDRCFVPFKLTMRCSKNWLQKNIDRISRTFHRPVIGIHNRT